MSQHHEIVLTERIEELLIKHQQARIRMLQELEFRPIMRETKPVFFLRAKYAGATTFVDNLLETRLNALDAELFDELLKAIAREIHQTGDQLLDTDRNGTDEKSSSSFASDNEMLYHQLIPVIGFQANEQDEVYRGERANTYVRFLTEFYCEFCYPSGHIDWAKLIAFSTDNLKPPSAFEA
jgi:hypothetical protein